MAIPHSLFQQKAGVALMRNDHSTGDWDFVAWINKGTIVDQVTPGRVYTYHIWLVAGCYSPIVSIKSDGWAKLVAMSLAR
jgi:hypothetical protein